MGFYDSLSTSDEFPAAVLFVKCTSVDFRLKTFDVVIRTTKEAENTLKKYEARLCEISKVPADDKDVEDHRNLLKVFPFIGKN